MSETCETCRFWVKGKRYDGECRIRAKPSTERDWPKTLKIDWCGEHEPKQAPKPNIMTRGDRPQPSGGEFSEVTW